MNQKKLYTWLVCSITIIISLLMYCVLIFFERRMAVLFPVIAGVAAGVRLCLELEMKYYDKVGTSVQVITSSVFFLLISMMYLHII